MTTYREYKVNLSSGQKAKRAKALKDSFPVTIRLTKNELVGNDEMMLTKSQINKLQKAKRAKQDCSPALFSSMFATIKNLVELPAKLWWVVQWIKLFHDFVRKSPLPDDSLLFIEPIL